MKHCSKDAAEPECLTDFRAASPSARWDDLRHEARECYQTLRESLRRSQRGLCAYCEIRLASGNEQIAHFHPKSDREGDHNWALDWHNLWLACQGGTRWSDQRDGGGNLCYGLPENRSCDEATENLVLDGSMLWPDEVPPFPRIFRYRQGVDRLDIEPDDDGCAEAGIPVERVRETIERLNLNCRRLAEARLAVHRPLENQKKKIASVPRTTGLAAGAGRLQA